MVTTEKYNVCAQRDSFLCSSAVQVSFITFAATQTPGASSSLILAVEYSDCVLVCWLKKNTIHLLRL